MAFFNGGVSIGLAVGGNDGLTDVEELILGTDAFAPYTSENEVLAGSNLDNPTSTPLSP